MVDLGPPLLRDVGLVFLGGSVGGVVRVAFAAWFPVGVGAYPWTTFIGNVTGAFLLAAVLTTVAVRCSLDPTVRLLVGTGVLGGFTTYSTLAVEVVGLMTEDRLATLAIYSGGSLATGILAALAGIAFGRRLGGGSGGHDTHDNHDGHAGDGAT